MPIKSSSETSSDQRQLAVGIPTVNHTELAERLFRDIIMTDYSIEQITHALDLIHGFDPPAIEFMMNAVTTGPKSARDEAAYKLVAVTENIAEACETGESWLARCVRTLGRELIISVMKPWSVECLTHDYKGMAGHRIHPWLDESLRVLCDEDLNLIVHPVSFDNWRGLAALAATRKEHRPKRLKEFVEYAGTAPDITAVIETAKARDTLDPVAIENVIGDPVGATLRDGRL